MSDADLDKKSKNDAAIMTTPKIEKMDMEDVAQWKVVKLRSALQKLGLNSVEKKPQLVECLQTAVICLELSEEKLVAILKKEDRERDKDIKE